MTPGHCPRCEKPRDRQEVLVVYHARPEPKLTLAPETVERSECDACGIYWDSDKPEWQWPVRGR
jgi:hypothetical protein